jgi:hypothetical protein
VDANLSYVVRRGTGGFATARVSFDNLTRRNIANSLNGFCSSTMRMAVGDGFLVLIVVV